MPLTVLKGNYVDAAIWTACEPAMGVVSACLPSLRPLWSLAWKGSWRGPTRKSAQGNTSSTSVWRSLSGTDDKDLRSFTRLEDAEGLNQWGTNATIHGGRRNPNHGEPQELSPDFIPLPERGIMVKREILISTSVLEYQDRLF